MGISHTACEIPRLAVIVTLALASAGMLANEASAQEVEFTPLAVHLQVTDVSRDPGTFYDTYRITVSATNTGGETLYIDLGVLSAELDLYDNVCESSYWIELGRGETLEFTGCYEVPSGSPLWLINMFGAYDDFGRAPLRILPFTDEARRTICGSGAALFDDIYCLPTQDIANLIDDGYVTSTSDIEFTPLDVHIWVTNVSRDPGTFYDTYRITVLATNTSEETLYVDLGQLGTELDL